ncbi:hypothetical protein DRQ36_04715 [bacterium]|nr:MAG: hypothetical protein DRQ36_04715 [bacterium]
MANETSITLAIFEVLGGVALFLYGIKKVTKSLEDLAGASLKLIITQLTKSRFRGFVIGLAVALSVQSSGAVMLMLVAFSNTGLLALGEAVSIILGAGVGTTFTVQLLAFRVHAWAPAMLLVGYITSRVTRSGKVVDTGRAIFSFGLVFLGMHLISAGTAPLIREEFFPAAIDFFRKTPLFAAVMAAILTFAFQSSTATLGLLLTLAFNGIIDVESAIPFIVGANIGSCGTAFLGAAGSKVHGYRVAWTEFVVRVITGIVVILLAKYYATVTGFLTGDPARGIAHIHTLYAITATVIFLPVSTLLAKLIAKIIPEPSGEKVFGPVYLDPNALSNPPVALGSAAREILREGDIVLSMVDDIIVALSENNIELLSEIVARDDKVDTLQEAVTAYLTKLTESELSEEESRTEVQLITFALELEHIADVVSKDLARHVEKRVDQNYYFSEEGFGEILSFHRRVRNLVRLALDAIPLRTNILARDIIQETKKIIETQRELNRSHIERLHAGIKFSTVTSALHIDLLTDMARIAVHVSHIGYAILGKV